MIGTGIADHASRRELTVLALIAGVIAFIVILYAETFSSMAAIWQSSGYRHCLIVPPICAYLLWRSRGSLAAAELRPCFWGIGPLIGVVGLWVVAKSVAVQVIEYLAAVLLIPATVLTFLGWPLTRRAMFPLLFLVAAVPVGEGFLPYLMLITADISTALLRAAGVPVFREGQFLGLPGGIFEVASVCAGLAYLSAGTFIALLFSYFAYQSLLKRAIFVMLMVVIMILTNSIRAFTVMYVASATEMRYFAGQDHVYFGWILFGVVLAASIHVGGRFADRGMQPERSVDNRSSQRPRLLPVVLVFGLLMLAATAQPLMTGLRDPWLWLWPATGLLLWTIFKTVDSLQVKSSAAPGRVYYRGVQGVLLLSVVPVVLASGPGLLARSVPVGQMEPLEPELPAIEECSRGGAWSEGWLPEFHLPDTVISGTYVCAGHRVNVFVAGYTGNTQGRELINSHNKAVPDSLQWRAAIRKHGFTSKHGQVIGVNELRVGLAEASSLVWYWYYAGDTPTTSPAFVKLKQTLDLLLMREMRGNVYVLHTSLDEGVDAGRKHLARVARQLAPPERLGARSAGNPGLLR